MVVIILSINVIYIMYMRCFGGVYAAIHKTKTCLEALCYYRHEFFFVFLRLRLLEVVRFSWIVHFASFSKLTTVHFVILYISLSLSL